MGLYTEHVLPRLLDRAGGTALTAPLRRRVCAGLAGEVVEVGFGSGHNVPYYPAAVTRVAAVEPSDVAWRLAGERLAACGIPVQRAGLDGAALPLPDAGFDAALTTWTLCTVPDVSAVLGELRRVLRPGGTLHFLEHGIAPDEQVRRWQRRLEPVQRRLAGGCHLTRPVVDLVTAAGFELRELDACYQEQVPRVVGALTLGAAVRTG